MGVPSHKLPTIPENNDSKNKYSNNSYNNNRLYNISCLLFINIKYYYYYYFIL